MQWLHASALEAFGLAFIMLAVIVYLGDRAWRRNRRDLDRGGDE